MKLLQVVKSTRPEKKLMAIFLNEQTGRKKTVHFGQASADDYTLTKDKEQRKRYRARHAKDLQTGDPTRAGFLSLEILWGNSVNRQRNIMNYKKKYNL